MSGGHTLEHFDIQSKFTEVLRLLNRANIRLFILNAKVNKLMSQQDEINALVTAEEADLAAIVEAITTVKDEVAAAIAANPAVDLSGLKDAEAKLSAVAGSVLGIVPAPAPAAPDSTPSA